MPSPDDTTTTTPTDAELIALVDERLRSFILGMGFPKILEDAVMYAVFGGGKRIRPVLCMRACEAVGGEAEQAVSAAAAIELVHTFSLVHDDLPAMDDDDLRRGRPTLHKHASEAMAILAGDAMTMVAFQKLVEFSLSADEPAFLVSLLAKATNGMIAGQVLDTLGGFEEGTDDFTRLQQIHHGKTGALLSVAVTMGAQLGNAQLHEKIALQTFISPVGLMFQAVDDLLDVTQSTEQVGKQTGKDAAAGKLTYPGLLGIDGTRAEIAKLLEQSLAALEPLGPRADPLRAIARTLAARTK